jgi:hypothetical protein
MIIIVVIIIIIHVFQNPFDPDTGCKFHKPLNIDWVTCQIYVPITETVKIINKKKYKKYVKNRWYKCPKTKWKEVTY